MQQFHLSKTLAGDMKNLMSESQDVIPDAMQWYGHRVMLQRRKCVLMMELQSRYCMVFTGMTKPDFEGFADIFADRLRREVISICQLHEGESEQLASLVMMIAEQQRYQLGSDRSVQAHLRQAAFDLEYMVNYKAGCLPDSDEEQFGCGVKINQTLRKRKGDKDYFEPLPVFRDFWLGLLEVAQAHKAKEIPDNVVPFRRR